MKRVIILPGSLEVYPSDATGGISTTSGRLALLLGFTHWRRVSKSKKESLGLDNLLEPMKQGFWERWKL